MIEVFMPSFVLGVNMNLIYLLLLISITCAAASFLLCGIARVLFPRFRSGEHKPGIHRPDLPAGGREIKTIELPLVGGPAFMLAIIGAGVGAGYLFNFQRDQWTLLLIGLGAALGYTIVGFIDDWNKVFGNEGISERAKFTGVFLVSVAAAALYFFLLPNSGQQSYSPYKDLPILSAVLCARHTTQPICPVHPGQVAYYGWLVFLMLMTGVIGSVTSLSVDFSDGLDGLAGGLVFSTALSLGIVVTGFIDHQHPGGIVLEVLALTCASGVLGFLPWNWPSSWAARRGAAKRRAKIIMGDSGSLGLGGILAMIAIFSGNELLLLMIGAAFVLEGLSALVQARLMTPFFRKRLQLMRFASTREFVPHTEFPLPFLAAPIHHHFDLLGWDRRRLVYGAWALGACFATLGVMANLATLTWQRYLLRILALILFYIIWSSASWSKYYFVGKYPAERTRRRRLALYYGYPYRLMGLRLYHLVEVIEASEAVIETPAEEDALWQRMNIFDARAILGLYCYRAGYYPAALAQWTRIPERNRLLRPEIARLLTEVENRLALEKQETQPIRRDQIIQQEPILSGNLPPADLPNPHEPVRSEETMSGRSGPWPIVEASPYPINNDGADHQVTMPLSGNTSGSPSTHNYSSMPSEHDQELLTPGSSQVSLQADGETHSNWLARLLHHNKSD
jgi:UDP-N-acetylmuramyl pentapeptide phosphotransferase/UDP-N-acetylglucosamine-1-phosphate transferase